MGLTIVGDVDFAYIAVTNDFPTGGERVGFRIPPTERNGRAPRRVRLLQRVRMTIAKQPPLVDNGPGLERVPGPSWRRNR
jgi:hypothetical protein